MKKFLNRCRQFTAMGLVALAASAAISETANAARRDLCFQNDIYGRPTAGARGRQMGERNARRLFNQMWQRLGGTCSRLENLANLIADVPLAAGRSEMGACFAQGYVETLFNELDNAYAACGDACYSAGSEIGQISAMGYCAASMALGGLDDPGFIKQPGLPFCGSNVVMGCKTEYISTAAFGIPGCRAFTEGQFEYTFDNTVRQDCFVPADVPIRARLPRYGATQFKSANSAVAFADAAALF